MRPPRSTRRQFELLVEQLELSKNWTTREFIAAVEQMRGRRIALLWLPDRTPVDLCGLWLARTDQDVVLRRRSSDPVYDTHILCHEVAHMLLDEGISGSPAELATLLTGAELGDTDTSVVQAARNGTYLDHAETKAEVLATMIMTWGRAENPQADRRALHRTTPAWQDLTAVAPQVVLPRTDDGSRWLPSEQLHRRQVEIQDAAAIVGRHTQPLPAEPNALVEIDIAADEREDMRRVLALVDATQRERSPSRPVAGGGLPEIPDTATVVRLWGKAKAYWHNRCR